MITITGRRDIEHNLAIEGMGQNLGAHIGQYLPGGKKEKSKKTKKSKRGRKNTKKRQTKRNRNKRTMRKK